MNHYRAYIKEREDFEMVETDAGFATFKLFGTECYIRDMYVAPDFRKSMKAAELYSIVSETAKLNGCTTMATSVCPSTKGAHENLERLLKFGFKLAKAESNIVYLTRGI